MNDLHLQLLNAARLRMNRAKRALTLATEAVYRRDPGAAEQADKAIAELTAARRELNRLLEVERRPAPVGEWAVAADFKREREDSMDKQ